MSAKKAHVKLHQNQNDVKLQQRYAFGNKVFMEILKKFMVYPEDLAIEPKDVEFVNELIEQMCDKYGEPATRKFITLLLSTLAENDN